MPVTRASGSQSGVLVGSQPTINDPAYDLSLWELRNKVAETLQALRNRGVISSLGGITLDYYSYLLSLNPWAIAPLNDPSSSLLNTVGMVIGSYSGTYLNAQTNLISKLSNVQSTRFNSGGAGVSASQSNPQTFTLVARVSQSSSASGSIFGFTNVTGFISETSFDRELYLESDGRLSFRVFTSGEIKIRAGTAYRDSVARTIVVRKDSTTISLWIEGTKISEANIGNAANYTGYWKIGYSKSGGFANGINMQGCAIYNTALSDSQIGTIQSFA